MNMRDPAPALAMLRRSLDEAVHPQTVRQILAKRGLNAHYQPIVQLKNAVVIGHESLIRGPVDSPLRLPDALFKAAHTEDLSFELEMACVQEGLRSWVLHERDKRLFLNLSAGTLVKAVERTSISDFLKSLQALDIAPAAVVVEITEHERITEIPRLIEVAQALRSQGLRFALDDFGDGRSSLRLWAELRPEIVKIDRFFVHGLHDEALKVQTLKGLSRFAETFGTVLLAEGIETADELEVVRDLGIELGQGYFLGRPNPVPAEMVLPKAAAVIACSAIAVLPEMARVGNAGFRVERLAVKAPTLCPEALIDDVAKTFSSQSTLRAMAVVEDDRPIGLVNRQAFVDRYARPYFKELYGRKPCLLFANTTPLILDKHTGLDALTAVLTSPDQRYLTEGFIITEGGRYLGLGTGEQLVRVVTEVRIEAARHANPLTFLPGNIPISEHIDRLLDRGGEFVACYGDLNDFKPFNDLYGYWRGDEMIRLVASTLVSHCDPRRDFVGHVGGDDFVVLFQSNDWHDRCERIIADFNQKALSLFDPNARTSGGIEAEDRYGVRRFFKCTTLSIGAVPIRPGTFARSDQVASAAAAAKHKAKMSSIGLAIEVS